MDGHIKDNDRICSKMTEQELKYYKDLCEIRQSIEEIDQNTIMEKIITDDKYEELINGSNIEKIFGCVAKASDQAPFTQNSLAGTVHSRLDYDNSDFVKDAVNKQSIKVVRFTTSTKISNSDFATLSNGYAPPCTESGFLGSPDYLIPEYMKNGGYLIKKAAIFEIDYEGNETLKAVYILNRKIYEEVK